MKNKFLLYALTFVLCFAGEGAMAQVLVNENFDGPTFPPSGWSNSTYTGTINTSGGPIYQWGKMTSGAGYPYYYDPNNPGYYTNQINPAGVNAHSGTGMAWANTYYYSGGNYGQLATPQINFSTTGNTILSFWFYTGSYTITPTVPLTVMYNTQQNGGGTGATIATLYPVGPGNGSGWTQYTFTLPAGFVSGDYIIFKAQNNYTTYAYTYDMLIDDVSITHIPPCTGTPNGTIVSPNPCPGVNFTMYFTDTAKSGLTYLWQTSPDNISWSNIASSTTLTTSITTPTYYRVIAQCTNAGGGIDTTSTLITLSPFYLCYCNDSTAGSHLANIGNVTVKKAPSGVVMLNNGNPSPTLNNSSAVNNYTDYSLTVAPITLYRDSNYALSVTQIQNTSNWNSSAITAYIDFNRDGIFQGNEIVMMDSTIQGASNPIVTDNFHVATNASVGITGMRILLAPAGNNPVDPCAGNMAGETEDYLVNIAYHPCNGPANAGTASASDTLMCPGDASGHYNFTLFDTSYEKQAQNLSRVWQISVDTGLTWTYIVASTNVDILTLQYTQPSWYRVQMVCQNSHDTTFSNIVKINNDSAYRCYCYSMAIGGNGYDSTDVGAFRIGTYFFTTFNPVNNSHLGNIDATNGRYNFTHDSIVHLYVDSTYPVMVYDVMKSLTTANAKITLFIDYNNNLVYDYAPADSELIWTTLSHDTVFYCATYLHTKRNVVTQVPTGMRLIINNNTAANIPSDEACGPYTSGETQDFVVMFHEHNEGVSGLNENINNLFLYPNPGNGKFNVNLSTTNGIKNLQVVVSNVTGQTVFNRNMGSVQGSMSAELDLSGQPRGIYFVEFRADGERLVRKLTIN